jgi:hypothetical protein
MSVNSSKPQDINQSSYDLRLIEIEAGFKKQEELSKIVENLSGQLNEVKTKLVRLFNDL